MSVGSTGGPVYLMDATIHAREWLATATILKIMDHVSVMSQIAPFNNLHHILRLILDCSLLVRCWRTYLQIM